MLGRMKETDRPFRRLLALADRHPDLTDAVVAAGFVAFGLASLPLAWPEPAPVPAAVAVVLVVALFAPLAWRRRAPVATLAAVTAAAVVYFITGLPQNPWFGNGWLLAAYSVGVYGDARWRGWARAGSAAALTLLVVAEGVAQGAAGGSPLPGNPALGYGLVIAGNVVFVTWIWLFGDAVRAGREREAELAERTRQLEIERETNARRAVLDERVRIARELHDVVAHHVSLMGVQAGAARRVLHQRPEQAEQALSAIEAASRDAVRELHRLLGFLRHEREQEQDGLAPQPSLRRIDALVAQMREAGLPVALEVAGEERPLPPAVDLSAYRIVQEALTNALRHAGPASATVRLRYGARDLLVEVIDDGRGADADAHGAPATGGAGLVGMRERVGLLGGRLRIERPAGGGFAVRAELPFDGRPA
jgi:signal transduction histidine kinase